MTESDRKALRRLAGKGRGDAGATTDDLQGLLLQVVFALLMVFVIAYFVFVEAAQREREEQILDLNRQKLVIAIEKVAEDHRIAYGLNALMTQGTDGRRVFDAGDHVKGGRLELAPAAKSAFASGSAAAARDYADVAALEASWREAVLGAAGLDPGSLTAPEGYWLDGEVAERVESMRLDVRGVQRALAARLQDVFVANPALLGDAYEARDAGAIADAIRAKSLNMVEDALGTEVLK